MRIKVAGINGYIGSLLRTTLKSAGYQVSGINRALLYGETKYLKEEISRCDVLINLAGTPILQRWTSKNKTAIYNSRIFTSRKLVDAINSLPPSEKPKKVISASAIGIYKSSNWHDECSTLFDEDFVGKVCHDWESEWQQLDKNVNKVIFRIGLVIGREAKTIKNLILPFKFGVGAKIGNGNQPFPFIHEKDLLKAFLWAVENENKYNRYNLVAPDQTNNKGFTKSLAKKLRRPSFLQIPSCILKLVLGEASILLLQSPAVYPRNLLKESFQFSYPSIELALDEIIA